MDVCLKSNGKALKKDTVSIGPCPIKKALSTKKTLPNKKDFAQQKKTLPTGKVLIKQRVVAGHRFELWTCGL